MEPEILARILLNEGIVQPGAKIRLVSCYTGYYAKDGAAHRLAKGINAKLILAPTDEVLVKEGREYLINNNGVWKTITP